ncbi:glutathione synthase/RimK-type ligase-like ATP-grasp enzyme [Paenibacillus castaneae]|uniref:YheC/YheD family endospore coat-associated protein n=1 Tax=Paenibacillus castaneae TaxID=474957 RepID=UPI000C99DFCF|nr:YheC/YheD family protein [Paenibacillus castaneae]NIK76058.1 glutathione synthase/RimK-type ligase-like ATP-grasp enzyme [Paenibacillus castaneae]
MAQPVLGILTLYLNEAGMLEEKSIYQKMTSAGRKLGLRVFVFTPKDVNYKKNLIYALFYDPVEATWSRKWTSFPNLIYDRCRIQRTYRFEQLKQFRARYGFLNYLNRPLRNKWTIHRILSKDARFKSHLPSTRYIESTRDVVEMLKKYPLLYLKPINGTGGRGILRIERHKDGLLHIQGRDQSRRIIKPQQITPSALGSYLAPWNLRGNRYIAQQGIQIKLNSGRVHDYRMLVQKNGEGLWEVTGCAGRIGGAGSITSNLHGGGHASTMETLLKDWLRDESKIETVKEEAAKLGVGIAAYLEMSYGRLCELALDLAIDRKGGIWLLEVNPKPAREVFAQAGEKEVYRNAIIRPLEYALWLHNQKQRRKGKEKLSAHRDTRTENEMKSEHLSYPYSY